MPSLGPDSLAHRLFIHSATLLIVVLYLVGATVPCGFGPGTPPAEVSVAASDQHHHGGHSAGHGDPGAHHHGSSPSARDHAANEGGKRPEFPIVSMPCPCGCDKGAPTASPTGKLPPVVVDAPSGVVLDDGRPPHPPEQLVRFDVPLDLPDPIPI